MCDNRFKVVRCFFISTIPLFVLYFIGVNSLSCSFYYLLSSISYLSERTLTSSIAVICPVAMKLLFIYLMDKMLIGSANEQDIEKSMFLYRKLVCYVYKSVSYVLVYGTFTRVCRFFCTMCTVGAPLMFSQKIELVL